MALGEKYTQALFRGKTSIPRMWRTAEMHMRIRPALGKRVDVVA
jgi:hypothetical protein